MNLASGPLTWFSAEAVDCGCWQAVDMRAKLTIIARYITATARPRATKFARNTTRMVLEVRRAVIDNLGML
jgi:hypothetical protein